MAKRSNKIKPKGGNAKAQRDINKMRDSMRDDAIKRQQQKQRGSIADYWKGVKTEMSKVVWPTRKELGAYALVVIFTCAIFALGFWGIDSGFLAVLRGVLGITLN